MEDDKKIQEQEPEKEVEELKEKIKQQNEKIEKLSEQIEKIGQPPREVPNPEPLNLSPTISKAEIVEKIYQDVEQRRLHYQPGSPHLRYRNRAEAIIHMLKSGSRGLIPNEVIVEEIEKGTFNDV